MNDSRHPATKCPACGYLFDAATGLGDATEPNDGAVSICIACGALGIFTHALGQLTVRPATPDELDALRANPLIRQALAVRARVIGDDLQPPKDPQ